MEHEHHGVVPHEEPLVQVVVLQPLSVAQRGEADVGDQGAVGEAEGEQAQLGHPAQSDGHVANLEISNMEMI